MLFMMALRRYDVGNDTEAYISFFKHMAAGDVRFDSRMEVGFRALAILVSKISTNPQVFLAICAALCLIPQAVFIWKVSPHVAPSVLLFWLIGCIPVISAARQGIAMGLIVLGYLGLRKQTKSGMLLYCLSCIIASLFHDSAIILILLPFIAHFRVTRNKLLLAAVLVGVMAFSPALDLFFAHFLGGQYAAYLSVQSGWAASLFNMAVGLAIWVIGRYNEQGLSNTGTYAWYQFKESQFLQWTVILYAVCSILAVKSGIIGRMATYFVPFMIVYATRSEERRNIGKIGPWILYAALFGYNVLALIIRPEWNSFFPFHFFWQ